jgi:hypothetical protein
MSLLSQDDLAYLRAQAGARGISADDLLKTINHESSGRVDVWGGKNNQYFGLLQMGPEERQKFGVDTVHPNARNQIDAGFKFLEARGFKPSMGLLDLYSTVNAGSPGHYNASDRPGMTVSKHVAAMGGASTPSAPIPGSAPIQPSWSPTEAAGPILEEEVAADEAMTSPAMPANLGLLAGLMPQNPQNSQLPQNPQDMTPQLPTPKRMAAPQTSGRGLALRQLTVKSPKFSKRG